MKKLLYGFVVVFGFGAFGMPSAHRDPGKSYREYLSPRPFNEGFRTAETVAKKFDEKSLKIKLDSLNLPNLSAEDGKWAFEKVRDWRFLSVRQDPQFLRRISWLYPDDGCFARAEMATRKFEEVGVHGVKKIFIFGDLMTETANSPDGFVSWWFHVVPLIKIDSEYYAIDPAIEASRPLTVVEWVNRMSGGLQTVSLSMCDGATYDPGTKCQGAEALPQEEATAHQRTYLSYEWFRMKQLGRDPRKVLGEIPPWKEDLGLQ